MHDWNKVTEYGSRQAWEAVFDVRRRKNPGKVYSLTPRPGADKKHTLLNGPAPTVAGGDDRGEFGDA